MSSNRIEGVTVDQPRVEAVVLGKFPLRDTDEQEVRGYINALKMIHQQGARLAVSEETILQLHRLSRANIGDAGQYKQEDSDIIVKYPDGRVRVRFKTVSARKTPPSMLELLEGWQHCLGEDRCHPLITMAAMNPDFLYIHPGIELLALTIQNCRSLSNRITTVEERLWPFFTNFIENQDLTSDAEIPEPLEPFPHAGFVP